MPRRQIGQERLALSGAEQHGGTCLDEIATSVDWAELDRLLSGLSASAKGESGSRRWRSFKLAYSQRGATSPTCASRRRSTTAPRSGAFGASRRTSPRRSAPPSSAS